MRRQTIQERLLMILGHENINAKDVENKNQGERKTYSFILCIRKDPLGTTGNFDYDATPAIARRGRRDEVMNGVWRKWYATLPYSGTVFAALGRVRGLRMRGPSQITMKRGRRHTECRLGQAEGGIFSSTWYDSEERMDEGWMRSEPSRNRRGVHVDSTRKQIPV
jgi:hypothetical protein